MVDKHINQQGQLHTHHHHLLNQLPLHNNNNFIDHQNKIQLNHHHLHIKIIQKIIEYNICSSHFFFISVLYIPLLSSFTFLVLHIFSTSLISQSTTTTITATTTSN